MRRKRSPDVRYQGVLLGACALGMGLGEAVLGGRIGLDRRQCLPFVSAPVVGLAVNPVGAEIAEPIFRMVPEG